MTKKSKYNLIERRKFIRLGVGIDISYCLAGGDKVYKAVTKNISADGLRFETADEGVNKSDTFELKLNIHNAPNPVHARAQVIWKGRLSLEDGAPFEVGAEFLEIEEDNKNSFLKFLCDILYDLPKENTDAKSKRR